MDLLNLLFFCAGFVLGYFVGLCVIRQFRRKVAKDAYSAYLEELAKNGNKNGKFDPHSNGSKIIHFPKNK